MAETPVALDADEKAVLVQRIKQYFREELDQEIGQFPAEFLLDFFTAEVGPVWFNKGVQAARDLATGQAALLDDALWDLEKPVDLRR